MKGGGGSGGSNMLHIVFRNMKEDCRTCTVYASSKCFYGLLPVYL